MERLGSERCKERERTSQKAGKNDENGGWKYREGGGFWKRKLGMAGNVDGRARKDNGKTGKEEWIKILEKEGMTQKGGCKGGLSRKGIQN
jgi:hypothetical protein